MKFERKVEVTNDSQVKKEKSIENPYDKKKR